MKRSEKIDRSMLTAHDSVAVSNLEDYADALEKRIQELEEAFENLAHPDDKICKCLACKTWNLLNTKK